MITDLAVINTSIIEELKKIDLTIPPNYSAENALKCAALIIDSTVDKNKRPAREVCSEYSIRRALMNMVIQGLNPAKNQCYFQVYGQKLAMMRSYMGSVMVAKSVVNSINEIRAEVVYEGDEFTFEVENGVKVIRQHTQTLQSIDKSKVVGAYALSMGCIVSVSSSSEYAVLSCEIMPIAEIHQCWKSSKQRVFLSNGGINPDSTHGKYPGEMAKRTVINRLCKMIINTSTDENLIIAAMDSEEERDMEVIVSEEIQEHSGSIAIDFKPDNDKAPKNKEIPLVPMANKDHFDMVMKLATELDCKPQLIADASTMFRREINRISDMTAEEAEKLIDMLDKKLVERGVADVVEKLINNATEDEPPSWAQEL